MTKKENKSLITKEVKIEGPSWDKALDKAFEKKNKEVEIKGFRKGKAPKDMYIKKYGLSSLFDEAASSLVDEAYEKAYSDDLEIIMQPRVDIKEINEKGVTFEFIFIVKPEFKINKYKNMGVKLKEATVTKEEVDHEIKHLLSHYSDIIVKDDKIKKGDIAVIDYEGFKDGVAFAGGKAEGYSLEIGSNSFIPGFEDALIGLKKGEEKDINLTFPKEYHASDLAGKDVIFKVKVNEVKEKKERVLDKELFEDLNIEGVKDEESLRKRIEEDLLKNKAKNNENEFLTELMDKIIAETDIELPHELIHEEAHNLEKHFFNQLRMQGLDPQMYFDITGQNRSQLFESLEKEARKNLESRFIMDEIAIKEKIEVDDKMLEEHIKLRAKELNMTEEDLISNTGGNKDYFRKEKEVLMIIEKLKELNK